MKLEQLRVEYHEQLDKSTKTRYLIVLRSIDHQHNMETTEDDFCELMKMLSKQKMIGNRTKFHATERLVILNYEVK